MKPVIHLEGCILQVRDIRRGETVGYGATFKAKEDMRVATIAAGYADGYLRALGSSNKSAARVYIGGRPAPVIGRISMDLIAADVTKIPKRSARRGAMAELIGPNIGIDKLAHLAGTIGYEILTGLSGRYHRLYLGGKLG